MPAKKTPATKAEAAVQALYEVVSPLNHDGESYAIGDQVELTAARAEPLLGHTVKIVEV